MRRWVKSECFAEPLLTWNLTLGREAQIFQLGYASLQSKQHLINPACQMYYWKVSEDSTMLCRPKPQL